MVTDNRVTHEVTSPQYAMPTACMVPGTRGSVSMDPSRLLAINVPIVATPGVYPGVGGGFANISREPYRRGRRKIATWQLLKHYELDVRAEPLI